MINVAADFPFNAPGMNSYTTSNTYSKVIEVVYEFMPGALNGMSAATLTI